MALSYNLQRQLKLKTFCNFSVTLLEIRIFLQHYHRENIRLKLNFLDGHGFCVSIHYEDDDHVTPSILSVPLIPFCLGWQLVKEDMERGFLESLGSVPTGGRAGR